ncbi:MAG: TetR/AcrR family transcriptional regulator [Allorhizobium sp.]
MVSSAPAAEHAIPGRFAAGEDPAKREQILDGAKRAFMTLGFDATSMNDVTRHAGVSKGTIYVYFQNKEELFGALVDRERGKFTGNLRDILAASETVDDGLMRFGIAFARHTTGSDMIPAMRTVLGVVDRMPGLCKRFFAATPHNAHSVLESFIKLHVEQGALFVDDTDLAARQFIELANGTFFKHRLFGDIDGVPPQEELDRVVSGALRVFKAAYGVKPTTTP